MRNLFTESEDLDWLFTTHLPKDAGMYRQSVVVTIVEGNEDAPERVELYDIDDYRRPPMAVYAVNEGGNLELIESL